jgi:hypothetical protein
MESLRKANRSLAVLLLAALAAGVLSRSASGADYPTVRQGGLYMFNYYFPPAPASTPWAPSWSPDGKWIAVGMEGSLWKVDPATGAAIELVHDGRYSSSPSWSPDGQWIIYTADDDGRKIQLAILNVASGETHSLTDDDQVYLDPVFSPDGRAVAYVSSQPSGYLNIYVRAIQDGRWAGDPTALTRDRRAAGDRLYVGAWDMHTQPAWTRDGKEIIFVSNREAPLGSGDLWRMPVEPDGVAKAIPIWKEQTLFRTRPDVSPDGKRIVYASTAGAAEQFNNLYVLPAGGGVPYKLTFDAWDHFHPRWSPDGEWIAYISNQNGLPQLALLETYGGARRTIAITGRCWKIPMGTLQARVIDESTGQVTAARIQGMAADGKFYPPAEAYSRQGNGTAHSFHTRGEFTVDVPPGKMTLEAVKGFEYWPAEATVRIEPGQFSRIELRLRRLTDAPARGWYSGSTHTHMNYGGNLRNTPENMIFMAEAEDVHAVMALAANKDNRVLDQQYFSGPGEHPASRGNSRVKLHFGEEYRPPFYGHTSFLGLKDHLISPFLTGYEGTAVESLYPSNTDMFRKAQAQGALTTYVHPFVSVDADPLETGLGVARALPVDAALGVVDCLEWSYSGRAQINVWHRLLDNDLALGAVGGEDSITNLHHYRLLGAFRTFAHLDGPFTVENWLEALRQGHTYASSGPILEFRINGKLPGEIIHLPPQGGTVVLEGTVQSIAPLSRVVIDSSQGTLKEIPLDADQKSARFRIEVPVTTSRWFSLSALGPPVAYLDGEYPLAVTSAIRVYVGDGKIRNSDSAQYFIRWIDKLRASAEQWPWWRSQREKDHVFAQFDQARSVYQRLAAEAH